MESHNNNLDSEGKAGPSNHASPSLDDAVGKLLQGGILIWVIFKIFNFYFKNNFFDLPN